MNARGTSGASEAKRVGGAAVSRAKPTAAGRDAPLRVLVVSDAHPHWSAGDAEFAAYQLYQQLSGRADVEAFFLAAAGGMEGPLGVDIFQPFGECEFIAASSACDDFTHANPNVGFKAAFQRLLAELRPDVVHFHHYRQLGVEAFAYAKAILPACRIVLTLHDLGAICHHAGEMVRRPKLSLCHQASPGECARCFPERSEADFLLRQLYLRRFFEHVVLFVAPSRFLAERYAAWGIPRERIEIHENGVAAMPQKTPPPPVPRGLVFGFFGRPSAIGGLDVVIDAAALIVRGPAPQIPIRIDVHGDLSNLDDERSSELHRLARQGVVRLCGSFEREETARLMARSHAVLVPSISWDGASLVVQHALSAGRPVLCSDIGGMAERVREGHDGFHFRRGDGASLAGLLLDIADRPEKLSELAASMATPPDLAATTDTILALYHGSEAAMKAGAGLQPERGGKP